MEYLLASRVNIAAAGLYAAPAPVFSLPGGGANARCASTAHGLTTGNTVAVTGTTGVTGLNANWPVRVIDDNTFELVGSGALTGVPAGAPAVALVDQDISGMDKEWFIRVRIWGTGVIVLEDTVNNWGATEKRFRFNSQNTAEGQCFSLSFREWKGAERFGTASAKMRVRLETGTNIKVSVIITTNP